MTYYEVPPDLPHDHALLEQLFYSVFESRFINSRPSCESRSNFHVPRYLTDRFVRSYLTGLLFGNVLACPLATDLILPDASARALATIPA